MKIFTTKSKKKVLLYRASALLLWIAIWQLAAAAVGQEVLIAPPGKVFLRLLELVFMHSFWISVSNSIMRITLGFFLALALGILTAAFSCTGQAFREFAGIPMTVIKSTPIASFIILALLFMPSRNLSVFISMIMVLPIVYFNTLEGVARTEQKLLEMAWLFNVPLFNTIRRIYLPAVMPFFTAACKTGFGIAWKSGVAAEIIGLPANAIGTELYNAKLFLNTTDVYAWTIVVILISLAFERLLFFLLRSPNKEVSNDYSA